MQWIEISVFTEPGTADEVASRLGRWGQGGSTIEVREIESSGKIEEIVKIYVPRNRGYKTLKGEIEKSLAGLANAVRVSERRLKPEDWLDTMKKDFGIMEIGQKFIIKPSWAEPIARNGKRIVIELDPGAAFGTGLHPTTRLCLIRLEKHLKPGMVVFDLGTGTGILSIASIKLGAASSLALDIDPAAVRAARDNARANGTESRIQIRRGTLSLNARKKYRSSFDIAIANITARAISDLSQGLKQVIKPEGLLIVSGIHAEGLDEVLVSLTLAGFKLEAVDTDGQWHAVVARKTD